MPDQCSTAEGTESADKQTEEKRSDKKVESAEMAEGEMTMDDFQRLSEKMRQNPGNSLGELVGRLGQVRETCETECETGVSGGVSTTGIHVVSRVTLLFFIRTFLMYDTLL